MAQTMNSPSTGSLPAVSLPTGFRFAGFTSGIKKSGRPDLSLIVSDRPTVAAAVLTTNLVHATSIDWCREILPSDDFRAVIVNSGNANACTGKQGQENQQRVCQQLAELLECDARQIAFLSTGIIGHQLPMEKLQSGLPQAVNQLANSDEAFLQAATAITTTDNARKTAGTSFQSAGKQYNITVMAKGAGMIGPNMATMLCVVVTDFPLSVSEAKKALKTAADQSFNAISVEGHMSTNDAMILLTSQGQNSEGPAEPFQDFQRALNEVTLSCAKLIPADGEGAKHLVQISVSGCQNHSDADRIARSIANSALVKTAIYGNDPNWGRIVSAAGYAGPPFESENVTLKINGTTVFQAGTPANFDAAQVSGAMKANPETHLELSVGVGPGAATHWTSDLTVDYVRFNSDYST